ncbi:glycerophosphodiester phosphodiesterase family protein [Paenibacillus chitinolyticus]|uniref:glycerophosphodiester phosphodiesterase family protein n=1 Tax=Paenibacillus chitinolyticus TaxID=79263 RepID=UPI003D01FE15
MRRFSRFLSLFLTAALLCGTAPLGLFDAAAYAADPGRKALDVRKTLTPPVIDGKLDESLWNVSETMNVRTGEGTFKNARFGMLWDNKYLYIGVKAEDDTLFSNGTGYWFEQDNINFFFDPTLHQSAPFAADDMQAGFVYKPGSTPEFHFGAALGNHSGKDEKKILRAIGTDQDGWTLETAIPWEMLRFDAGLQKQLGFEIGVTDRYEADTSKQRTSYWSAYNSKSFWNDTAGYGILNLKDENPVSAQLDPVLLQDNFDGYPAGHTPAGWISDTNAGSDPFTVVQDTYGNGRMAFDGKASGKQARISAPVQWDDYIVEADMRFEEVLNDARWAALMFRGAADGKNPYNQMAVRRNGTFELAYRMPNNNWASPTPVSGMWKPLEFNKDYTLKVRAVGNNVKEYIKAKDEADFTLLMDQNFSSNLLEKGKVGFQADQSKVSFDNLKVTRVTAERLDVTMPGTLEALTGPATVTGSVYYSDGVTETPAPGAIRLYSSDETIVKIVNNQLYPVKAGKVTVKAVYANAEAAREITVTPSATGAQAVKLQHAEGYVLTDTGVKLDLNTLSFQAEFSDFSKGTLKGGELQWKPAGTEVAAANGTLQVNKKGAYPVTVQKDNASLTLMVIAKNPGEKEYTLYEENFDQVAEGALPKDWTRKEGTTASAAAVKSGAFELNASGAPDNPSRVLLPEYLGLFGNYKIEADMTHLSANDAARWHSIMFRIQNDNVPYYQMAVRQNAAAANGVEFAERTPANEWNVMDRASYTEAIDPAKMYHYTVKAYGDRVQEWIGDKLLVDTDNAGAYKKGRIGLQANGSRMKVDNIRVTLQQDALPPLPSERFVQVVEPETKISLAPTVVTELKSSADLVKLQGTSLPATAMMYVNGNLKITAPGGAEIAGLDEILGALNNKVIPAFYVRDELSTDKLVEALKTRGIEDAFIVSDKGELVKKARLAYPIIRGILDFRQAKADTNEDLMEIRRKTTVNLAKIALLSQKAATRESMAYLQQRALVVWAQDQSVQADKTVSLHNLITGGANGIVTDAPEAAIGALKLYSNGTTLIRKPYIIGHRGIPSEAPENTIESNALSLEYGADYIENDMYLTKDGHLVIVHDSVLENTTNGKGKVEDFTLAELKKLNANKPFPTGYPDVKIPTLDEQIDLARSKGRMVMAEIKTSTPAAVDAFVRILKEKKAEDIVDAMSFDTNQLKRLAELMPEMPSGLLTSGYANEANVNKSLRETLKVLQPLNATFNTSYGGLGKNFMEAAKHRGVIISPWTFNNKNDFMKFFGLGAFGITTDYASWAADWAASVKPGKSAYTLSPGENVALSLEVESYRGTKTNAAPDIVLLDGQDVVEVSGSKITGKKAGKAHALLRYTASMDANNKYDLYTQPVTLEVKGGSGGNDGGSGGDNGSGGNNGNNGGNNGNNGNNGGNNGNNGNNGGSAGKVTASGGAVDASALREALKTHSTVEIAYTGDTVEIPASALMDAPQGSRTLVIAGPIGKYTVQLADLKLDEAARKLGGESRGMTVRYTLRYAAGTDAAAIGAAVKAVGLQASGTPVQLEIAAKAQSGGSAALETQGQLELTLNGTFDAKRATGVRAYPNEKKISFAPSLFAPAGTAKTAVTFKRSGSGFYAVVSGAPVFADMAGHWAQADVELLAAKLVVEGSGGGRFDAERSVTRAEFAALLVRALGLPKAAGPAGFGDVGSADWFAGDVAAAAAAGLIGGYEDGSFRPQRPITREEQAAMLVRALPYAGAASAAAITKPQQEEILARYTDSGKIVWAQAEVAAAVQAGLMNGVTDGTLAPASEATRAQSAVMLGRFLVTAGFIN